ncbi:MAG: S-methyl-5'-thioinosine phosphorylase [endosymbiont of Galathealinum brachiosum]|uniref:Probable 6-oxopurine nucleoside phosphorylase n=1 Tax=endosymbiont of Galathealinum brachiosum TaxID=2200906 RepID=A0A370DGM9_9GAMM|nr:MAG: S-methyl-5'-thioinosine phosphorylase [endosymbiont of Galathealinum brachiosum]
MKNNFEADIAIIGGTGLYQLDDFEELERRKLVTRWGDPSSELILSRYKNKTLIFLARHGLQHNIPPHKVNYRANLWALKECGVKQVIGVAAVGGITEKMSPETIVIPDQIIDYTYSRKHTYFEDELDQVTHIDFTEPYTEDLRSRLLLASDNAIDGGTYAATQGPRLETAAEINKLRIDGSDIVGMTGMPEASLAREIELEYACCALSVNWAAGCAGTKKIDHKEMLEIVDKGMLKIHSILKNILK